MFSWSNKHNKAVNISSNDNGGNGGASSSSSGPSISREEHIRSLLSDPTLKPSTRRVSTRDDSTYDTVFSTKDSVALILRVHLPGAGTGASPSPAPKMTLVGFKGRHPWIDRSMKVTGYAPIQSNETFANSRMTLGRVVNNVVQHFQLNPPSDIVIVDEGLKQMNQQYQMSNGNNGSGSSGNTSNMNSNGSGSGGGSGLSDNAHAPPNYKQSQQQHKPKYPLPPHFTTILQLDQSDVRAIKSKTTQLLSNNGSGSGSNDKSSFSEIQSMDRSTITTILDDNLHNSTIPNMIKSTPTYNHNEEKISTILSSNASHADENLTEQESTLNVQYAQISELQTTLNEKVELHSDLKSQVLKLSNPNVDGGEVKEILYQLKLAKKKKMEESEALAYEWLSASSSGDAKADVKATNEFVEEFLQSRIVHHVRAAKMERIEYSSGS
mmetsp:Transcript_18949/g.27902  ORF Transcript_18949/g.27902 Transcript_18949/m.27902 type:complete len:438 (-) Transcript_18949:32-1345(-)